MIAFTNDFKTAATADIRDPSAYVQITWGDPNTDTNVNITANDTNRIDRKGQVLNGFELSGQKWYYLHDNLTINDEFRLCPETDGGPQMGWWTQELGDINGEWAPGPRILTITHDPRSYRSVQVVADDKYGEYPVDFDIDITHNGGVYNIPVTGHTGRVYTTTFPTLSLVTQIQLSITKWSAPETIIKITQFSGILQDTYESDDIISLDILEETNSDTGTVPIGNVSSNELDISLINTDRRFTYGNADSSLNRLVIANRKIQAWLGFRLPSGSTDATGDVPGYIVNGDYGYMPWGIYWARDWSTPFQSMEASTSCYDVTYLLSQSEYTKSQIFSGPVGTIIDNIMTTAREDIPGLDWEVSADIASTVIFYDVVFETADYLTILKRIGTATLSYSYVDRTGKLIIGSRLGIDLPVTAEQQLDLSDYYDFNSQPKTDEIVNSVRVGYTNYIISETIETIYQDDENTFVIPASGVLNLYLKWSQEAVSTTGITVQLTDTSGTPVISSLDTYAVGADVQVSGSSGDSFKIVATGYPYELVENTETVALDADSINTYGVRELAITGNRLITSESQARSVADNLLSFYGDLRRDATLSWNGSTLVSVGDTLDVLEFKSDSVTFGDYFLIKRQTLSYDGGLESKLELRRRLEL